MTIVGYACIVVAVIWILYKIQLAYKSQGGRMVVTVYDAAFYPPPLAAIGLYLARESIGIDWAIWVFILLALGAAVLVAGAIKLAEEMGDRPL